MKIEIQDSEINVEEIMRQIRENIRNRKYDGEVDLERLGKPHLHNEQHNFSMDELLKEQAVLNRVWSYSADYHITSHKKFIGRLIVFAKKVVRKCLRWYMNPVVDNQVHFNATVVRSINQLVEFTRVNDIDNAGHNELEVRLNQLEMKLDQLMKSMDQLNKRMNQLDVKSKELEKSIPDNQFFDQILSNMKELDQLKLSINLAGSRLRRLERTLKGRIPQDEYQPVHQLPSEMPLDFDYYLFEEYFRGSREQIMEIQKRYLKYFTKGQVVLDLGCGRGEFLELLMGHGVDAVGVDLNDDMIAYCRERGLTVHKADLLEYLSNVEDNSVDGIFLGQVIEHLQPGQLIRLIQLAHDKLKTNGVFIAETPNPRSLSIFAQSFYMDLTHTKPVHPLTAKFLLETEGFRDIEIFYFSPNNESLKLPELVIHGTDQETQKQFNETLKLWHNLIFGEQDYYIVSRK